MKDNKFLMLRLVTNAPQCSKRVYRALKIFDSAEDIFSADRKFFLMPGLRKIRFHLSFLQKLPRRKNTLNTARKTA